jgi:AAHS family 4-hydroxybenzoate transporter-like MFS transporter
MSATFDVGAKLDSTRWSGLQKWFVFLVALTIVFDGIDNQLLAIAIPAIMRDWSVPRSAFAFVLASGMFGMMIGGALAGIAGDRLGRKTALLGSVLVFGILTLAVSVAGSLQLLTLLRFLSGLGLGGAIPNAAALASEFVPRQRRAIAVTLAIVCVPLGGMLAAVLAEVLPPAWGWRGLFVTGGLLPVAATLALVGTLPESPRFLTRHPQRWRELATLMKRLGHDTTADTKFVDSTETPAGRVSISTLLVPEFRRDTLALWLGYFSCLLAVYSAFNWVPSLLAAAGLASIASRGILAFNAGGAVGAVLGAIVIGRIGSRQTMLVMAAGAVAGCFMLAAIELNAATSIVRLITLLAVTGGLINAVQTTMYALAAQVYPTDIRSTGVGTAVAIGRGGGVISTYAGQWAIASGGSARFFALIGCAMAVVFGALAAVKRHIGAATFLRTSRAR